MKVQLSFKTKVFGSIQDFLEKTLSSRSKTRFLEDNQVSKINNANSKPQALIQYQEWNIKIALFRVQVCLIWSSNEKDMVKLRQVTQYRKSDFKGDKFSILTPSKDLLQS